jgi:hypothetical protein
MRQILSIAILASVIGSFLALAPAEARHRHYFGNYANQNLLNTANPLVNTNPFTGQFGNNYFHHRHHHRYSLNGYNGYNGYNNSLFNNATAYPYNSNLYNTGWNNYGQNPWGLGNTPVNGWPTNIGNGLNNGNVPNANAWGYWRNRIQQGNRGWW